MLSPRSFLFVLCVLNSGYSVLGLLEAWMYPMDANTYTYFHVYTPTNRETPYILNNQNASSIKDYEKFNGSMPMKMLIHGYWRNSTNAERLRDRYLLCGKYNVVVVLWLTGVDTYIYWVAQTNAYFAGNAVAKFLTTLQNEAGVQMDKVSIISHGLGCNVASIAGKQIGNLSTIVAVEASWNFISGYIDRNAAQYVQAIHTETLLWGTVWTVGHADFYVNGGEYQPGCSIFNPKCSHSYAVTLFVESVPQSPYSGCRRGFKNDCGYVLGGDPLRVYNGIFDVNTREDHSAKNPSIWNLYNLLVLIPGYWPNKTTGNILRDKYLECGKYNVIIVDWSAGTNSWLPMLVETNIFFAGHAVAQFLQTLQSDAGLKMDQVSIISHGFGCTIAGLAGNRLGNLSSIVALDPSWGLISGGVSRSSASYVQAIHTGSIVYGTLWTVGSADFYVNGGYLQPQCSFFNPRCNHVYAALLFVNSVYDSPYTGCRAGSKDDCGYVMGGDPLRVYNGVFHVCLDDGSKPTKSNSSMWNLYGLL